MKTNWLTKKLGEVLEYEQPTKYLVGSTEYKDEYLTPVLTAGKTFILGNTNEKDGIFPKEKLPVIIFDDFTTAIKFVDFPFKVKSSAMKILHPKKDLVDARFVFYKMKTIDFIATQHKRYWISKYSEIKISLPPIADQKRIVEKIEKIFAKIDEASRLRAESSSASAALLPSALHQIFNSKVKIQKSKLQFKSQNWQKKKLGEVCDLYQPKTITLKKIQSGGPYKVFGANGVIGYYDKYNHEDLEVLVTCRGATCGSVNMSEPKSWITGNAMVVHPKIDNLSKDFLFFALKVLDMSQVISGSAQPQITRTSLSPIEIPLPPIAEQKKIVAYLDALSQKTRELQNLQKETATDFSALRQSVLSKAFE